MLSEDRGNGYMVCLDEVSKFILNKVSLCVPQGQCVGLIGASGAGKTTLIRLICGLLAPDSGRVRTLGKDPAVYRARYGGTLSVFMAGVPLLAREDTVRQGFELLRAMYHIPAERFRTEYSRLEKALDFGAFAQSAVRDLSLGQRMRAELGAALVLRPALLLLDEPNVGLDENGKAALRGLLEERCREGMTVLLTSHDLAGVSKACGRIALLDRGSLMFYGSEENLRSKFAPTDEMTVTVEGALPDLEDIPLLRYIVAGNRLTMTYNSNHVDAAEILGVIMKRTRISSVSVRKPDLESICRRLTAENERAE